MTVQRIQWKRGTAAQWTANNQVLALAEVGYERDTGKVKIGDGASTWTALPYATFGISGGGVSDGDKGDIVVSAGGTTWQFDSGVVTAFARTLLDDGDAATARATLGAGDVAGPGSSTDNAIARYDGTTGKIIQNSAATVRDDGVIRSATNGGANTVSVPLVNWIMLTANYTLNNVNTEQKAFNTTTNGTLTLPTGVYFFEAWLYLLSMSATSGNLAFDPVGAGTAVTDRWGTHAWGIDAGGPLTAGTQTGSATVTQQTVASLVTAGTGAGLQVSLRGMFRVSTGGTIIPSVTLVTGAAAIMQAGSWFKVSKIGESSEAFVGAWT